MVKTVRLAQPKIAVSPQRKRWVVPANGWELVCRWVQLICLRAFRLYLQWLEMPGTLLENKLFWPHSYCISISFLQASVAYAISQLRDMETYQWYSHTTSDIEPRFSIRCLFSPKFNGFNTTITTWWVWTSLWWFLNWVFFFNKCIYLCS